jgi:anti-anti-sigma regulatory factor
MNEPTKTIVIRLLPTTILFEYADGGEARPETSLGEHRWSHYADAIHFVEGVIDDEVEAGHKRFIVDVSETVNIVSSDLGAFVSWFQRVKAAGGTLVFVANERARSRLSVTGLLDLFGDFDSIAEAQAHLEK